VLGFIILKAILVVTCIIVILDEVLCNTPWQYSQLSAFYLQEREPMEVATYLYRYMRYPVVEYLIKFGLTRIAAHLVYSDYHSKAINPLGKNLREVLGIEPESIPILQEVNACVSQLELAQAMQANNIRIDADVLRWYESLSIRSTEDFVFTLKHTTPMKLMRYIDSQYEELKSTVVSYGYKRYENPGRVFSEYKDYLNFATKLEYDLKNEFVLFPRYLNKAHDSASELYQKRKNKIQDKAIKGAYMTLLSQYGFTHSGLTVIPPKTAYEIIAEGHALRHCVGSYIENIINGKTTILFIRKTDEPNASFVTMELRDNKISQARGQNNGIAPPEVGKFLEYFKRAKLNDIAAKMAA
jgi:hypothetical protein